MMNLEICLPIIHLLIVAYVVFAVLGAMRRFSVATRSLCWCAASAAFGGCFAFLMYPQLEPLAKIYVSFSRRLLTYLFPANAKSWLPLINTYGDVAGVLVTGICLGALVGWCLLRTKVWDFSRASRTAKDETGSGK